LQNNHQRKLTKYKCKVDVGIIEVYVNKQRTNSCTLMENKALNVDIKGKL